MTDETTETVAPEATEGLEADQETVDQTSDEPIAEPVEDATEVEPADDAAFEDGDTPAEPAAFTLPPVGDVDAPEPVDPGVTIAETQDLGSPITPEQVSQVMADVDNGEETIAMTYAEAMEAMAGGAKIKRAGSEGVLHLGIGFTSTEEDKAATDWVIA